MPGKMARSDPRPSVRVTRGVGSGQHLASVLQEGLGDATDEVSGDKAWWFDFTDVEIPGTYTVVDIDKGLRSVEFEIDNHVYRNVLKHAVRMFFYRAPALKKPPRRPDPTGQMLQAIWAPGRIVKPTYGGESPASSA